jgi:alpha-beta hydrolase superfamily lysophospholipase
MKTAARLLLRTAEWLFLILATVVLVRAFDARKLPDLKPWHRVVLQKELTAAELTERFTLADYMTREAEVFREVREGVVAACPDEDRTAANRYFEGSPIDPGRFPTDWNRTFELVPAEVRGGALLIHGLTDAPYSMRRTAELLRSRGIYALCLRMPGHGTVPAALTQAHREDWLAAVRFGARHVRKTIGDGKPFTLVGYSNGAALVMQYSLEALESASLPKADKIVLLSPMIGVTPFPAIARLVSALHVVPYFEKSRWMEVLPEYNPFKYNSFPVSAARQTLSLTGALQEGLRKAADQGRIGRLPPILAFQSLADSTVSPGAVVDKLYDRLADNGSELVLFDINRSNTLKAFLKSPEEALVRRLSAASGRRYGFRLVTNARPDTLEVVELDFAKGGGQPRAQALGLAWPPQVFSLSHVALPFSLDDPLYGLQPDPREDFGVRIGLISPHGERSILTVPMENVMRLTSNPFFPYVERRIADWLRGEK